MNRVRAIIISLLVAIAIFVAMPTAAPEEPMLEDTPYIEYLGNYVFTSGATARLYETSDEYIRNELVNNIIKMDAMDFTRLVERDDNLLVVYNGDHIDFDLPIIYRDQDLYGGSSMNAPDATTLRLTVDY